MRAHAAREAQLASTRSVSNVPARRAAWLSLPALRTHTVMLVLVPLSALAVAIVQPVDFDYWWHRRTGQWIVQHAAFPRHDVFSFTNQGKAWVDHEWLSQIFIYLTDSAVGYLGLFLVFMALGVAAWWMIYRVLRREGLGEMQALALSIAPAAFGATYWRVRPAMFTVFFVALFLSEMFAARRGERRTLWRLVPIMVLWANLHGGYAIGLAMIAMLAAAQWWDRNDKKGPSWRHLSIVLVAAFAAAAFNPYTYQLWLYPLSYLGRGNASMQGIDEWASPNFHQYRNAPLAVLLVLGLLIGANGRRFDAWRTLLLAVFGLMALQAMRHQPLFALVWAAALGPSLLERWPWWGRELGSQTTNSTMNFGLLAAGVIALAGTILVSPAVIPLRDPPTGGSLPYPVAGAAWIDSARPGARTFNEYSWGGYLIDRLYPREQVFIDGRADLHGALLLRYDAVLAGQGWQATFAQYGVDTVLVMPSAPLVAKLKDAGWATGFEDKTQIVLTQP